MVTIRLVLINKYGEFVGRTSELSIQNYNDLLGMVKTFYMNDGFELTLEDGTFVVFPTDIVKESILKVVKVNEELDYV
jgi:hypothetical protein